MVQTGVMVSVDAIKHWRLEASGGASTLVDGVGIRIAPQYWSTIFRFLNV